MQINKATTEGFAVYSNFHINLNLAIKVATASVSTVKRIVDVPNGNLIMGQLIDVLGLPWGKSKSYPNPTGIIDRVVDNISANGVVHAFSGFEFYLTHLIADLANFSILRDSVFKHAHTDSEYKASKPPTFANCCFAYAEQYAKNNVLSNRIETLKGDLNVTDPELEKILPLFNYFRLLRNCVAHLEGIANKDLIDHSKSTHFLESYEYWISKSARGRAPKLPELTKGKKIAISAVHSIFCSAVNYKIAQILDTRAVQILTDTGLTHMACYYALLIDEHEFRSAKLPNSPQSCVAYYLNSRYLARANHEETIQELIKCNIWKTAIDRYEFLLPPKSKKNKK